MLGMTENLTIGERVAWYRRRAFQRELPPISGPAQPEQGSPGRG
jgi:hypothetical protein